MNTSDVKLTQYQKFEVQTIKRSQINPAPYNPRMILKDNEKKLKSKISEVGLIDTVVWNKRSGNLVGGHQRLKQIDSLEEYPKKTKDYMITVSVCDLDDKTEKEMVVFLNNPSTQGEWDLDLLGDIIGQGVKIEDMGFNPDDISYLFDGDMRFSELLEDTEEVKKTKEEIEKIREHRAESLEEMEKAQSADFYFTVVCKNQEEKDKLLRKIGMPIYEEYINGEYIEKALDQREKANIRIEKI